MCINILLPVELAGKCRRMDNFSDILYRHSTKIDVHCTTMNVYGRDLLILFDGTTGSRVRVVLALWGLWFWISSRGPEEPGEESYYV